ncbi:putative membrane protein, partial [Bacteroides fragilis str. 3783N1-2]
TRGGEYISSMPLLSLFILLQLILYVFLSAVNDFYYPKE